MRHDTEKDEEENNSPRVVPLDDDTLNARDSMVSSDAKFETIDEYRRGMAEMTVMAT